LSQDTYKSTASRCGSTGDDALRFPQSHPLPKTGQLRPSRHQRLGRVQPTFITLAERVRALSRRNHRRSRRRAAHWQRLLVVAGVLRASAIDGSIGNPTLINSSTGTTGLLLYRITLHNSPKFHVKITSYPADGDCSTSGKGFIVWGVTILTPSQWTNSRGDVLTPSFRPQHRWHRPRRGKCGPVAGHCISTISTGDDQIAIKGGHLASELVVAHNHFGTGHGMSIGSETLRARTRPTMAW